MSTYWDQVLYEVLNKDKEDTSFFFTKLSDYRAKIDNELIVNSINSSNRANKMYWLNKKKGLYLTQREAECVIFMWYKYTLKKTAYHLGLSPRTIEFYINNIKNKLICRTKKELCSLLVNTDFNYFLLNPKEVYVDFPI